MSQLEQIKHGIKRLRDSYIDKGNEGEFIRGFNCAINEMLLVLDRIERTNVGYELKTLRNLGYKPRWNPDINTITFYYFGNKVTFYTKKQYFNGKGLEPGFGFDNLVDQLKRKPIPRPKVE